MKGLILCAGKGTRLYPLTRAYPKTLIPVANIPILHLCLEKLVEQEILEIGIVLHPSQQAMIDKQVGNGDQWGVKLTFIYQNEPNGIADAVRGARSFIQDDEFMLLLGDNLITESLSPLKEQLVSKKSVVALLVTTVENTKDFGIAEVIDHQIVKLIEKPLFSQSNLAVMGAYAFDPIIFQGIDSINASPRGEYEITDAIQWLIDQGHPVTYHQTDKQNFDVGTLDRWLSANQWMLNRRDPTELVHESTHMENCEIIPPVAIGPGCKLINCRIGPYVSIGAGSSIEDCSIQNSILLNEVHIKRIPYLVCDTIIGFHSIMAGLIPSEKVSEN